jgi:phosphoribosylformylglycinamidine cyclo-ligase
MSDAYGKAGVNVDIEAEASRLMHEASKESFENRKGKIGEVIAPIDDFAALKMVSAENFPAGTFFSVGFDTIGTKAEIVERTGVYNTIAFDLFAMVCDDAVLRGGEPVLVGTTLDVKTFGNDASKLPILKQLAEGYVAAAKEANVAIINGEIAQMGSLLNGYGDFPFHWGAACVWFAKKENLLTGMEIKAGDTIIALKENGFRCNGWSLVRKIFEEAHGAEWHTTPFEQTTLGLAALTPSIIYSRFVVGLHGGMDTKGVSPLHGVAHITGGGIPEKLGRVLRTSKLGARLTDLYELPSVMAYAQKTGTVSDTDAYGAWNMGQGMLLITNEPEKVLAYAKEKGFNARVAGEVTAEPGITIVSRGVESPGNELHF